MMKAQNPQAKCQTPALGRYIQNKIGKYFCSKSSDSSEVFLSMFLVDVNNRKRIHSPPRTLPRPP